MTPNHDFQAGDIIEHNNIPEVHFVVSEDQSAIAALEWLHGPDKVYAHEPFGARARRSFHASTVSRVSAEHSKTIPTKSTKPMSDKKPKTTKEKKSEFRLVPFADLPVRHKGAGVGSAFEVLGELVKQKHITAMNKSDVERHKYVLDEADSIRGVAICLEVELGLGTAKSWDSPRDIRLWSQMFFPGADRPLGTEGTEGTKGTKVASTSIAEASPMKSLAGPAPHVESVIQLAVEDIEPCPLNPREIYDDARTQALAANIRAGGAGIIHALLVRPAPGWEPGTCYEVIAGHRRLAAAKLLGLATVPVVVREISDEQALVIMMSENLQREDLSPIEEARGYRKMLDLTPQTNRALGAQLGKTELHIGDMLRLLRLPSVAVKALNEKVIGVSVGILISRVPGDKMREKAAKQVLAGFGTGPLTRRETEELLAREYIAELRGVPWEKSDAKLYPEVQESGERVAGGACDGCPFSEAGKGKLRLCTNLECFREKGRLHVETVKRSATSAGALVVDGKHAEKYLYHDGTVRKESGMVKLSDAPPASEVNGTKAAPTWGKMLAGKEAKTVVVIDAKGKSHELVERKVALEVAKSNGFSDLLDAKAALASAAASQSGEGRDTAAAARAEAEAERARKDEAEKAKAKLEKAITTAALEELVVNLGKRQWGETQWDAMFELAMLHAGSESLSLVAQRRKIKVGEAGSRDEFLRDYNNGLEPARRPGLVVELLLAGLMKHSGIGCKAFRAFSKACEVDLDAVAARVKKEVKK